MRTPCLRSSPAHTSTSKTPKRRVLAGSVLMAASRTPLWLASRLGCRGRRLSTERGNPGRPRGSWQCPQASRRHAPVGDAPAHRWVHSEQCRDGRGFSEILLQLRAPDERQDRLLLAHKRGKDWANCSCPPPANQVRTEKRP